MTAHQLVPLAALILNLGLAAAALARNASSALHRVFAAFALAVAVWNFGAFGLRRAADAETATGWQFVLHVGVVLLPPLYVHLVACFLDEIRLRRRLIAGAYTIAAAFLLLDVTASPLFIRGVATSPWGFTPATGPAYPVFLLFFNVAIVGAMVHLARAARRLPSSFRRNRARLIVAGTAVSFVGGLVDFARFVVARVLPDAAFVYPVGIPANIVFTLALGLAIVRYRLFDVHTAVMRAALSGVVAAISAVLVLQAAPAAPWWLVAVVVALAGILVSPLAGRLDHRLRSLVLARPSRGDALMRLSRRTTMILDAGRLVESLVQGLVREVPLTYAVLLVHDPETKMLAVAGAANATGERAPAAAWPEDSASAQLVRHVDGVLVVEEARAAGASPAALAALGDVALAVPLRTEDRLVGILLLGEKLSREIFDHQELEVLAFLASQAAIALENARLYRAAQRAYDELARAQDQLAHAQRMDAVGRLAGGIAHDFNNMLTVILGRASTALETLPDQDPLRRPMALIEQTAERAAQLVRQLLAFSRRQILKPRVLDVDRLVADMSPMLRSLAGEPIRLVVAAGAGDARVEADSAQLEQVVVNLVMNARDAMPRGGTVTIETATVTVDVNASGAPAGRYVVLAVTDTGVGMDAATQARIFEPFYTTKPVGQGTGLGLATAYGVVEQSGGHIRVTSAPGMGTRIEVRLPLVEGSPDAVAPAQRSAPARGRETILVVEDEDEVRLLAAEILRRYGYTVLTARDASEALQLVHGERADLVLSDVVMPGLSGPELVAKLRVDRPGLRAVFMSGYAEPATLAPALESGAPLLPKPFTPHDLLAAVRATLDGR